MRDGPGRVPEILFAALPEASHTIPSLHVC